MSQSTQRVEQLIELTGIANTTVKSMKQAVQDCSKDVQEELDSKLKAVMPAYMNHIKLMYIEHFTDEEIEQIIAFHQSSVAQKMRRLTPVLMDKSWSKMTELLMKAD